jgi:hypothetical protein
LTGDNRYNAACYAALAGCGQSADAGRLTAPARAALREQARAWLQADLAVWKKQLASGRPANRDRVAQKLTHWLRDADLTGTRGGPGRIAWTAAERVEWDHFWTEVRSTLAEAENP